MNDFEQVVSELKELGYEPASVDFPGWSIDGKTIVFSYDVNTGRYKGCTFRIGLSFQERGYPHYPPHFIHVESLENSRITAHSRHSCDGIQWLVFSVPPGDFWDQLPTEHKNMKTYIRRHILRFWGQI